MYTPILKIPVAVTQRHFYCCKPSRARLGMRHPTQPRSQQPDSQGHQTKAPEIQRNAAKIHSDISEMPEDDGNRLGRAMLSREHRSVTPKMFLAAGAGPLGLGERAVYLRSRSEPFGEESERKAPGGGPLSWGDTEVKHFPDEEGAPQKTTHPPASNLLPGSSTLRMVGGGEKLPRNPDFWGD